MAKFLGYRQPNAKVWIWAGSFGLLIALARPAAAGHADARRAPAVDPAGERLARDDARHLQASEIQQNSEQQPARSAGRRGPVFKRGSRRGGSPQAKKEHHRKKKKPEYTSAAAPGRNATAKHLMRRRLTWDLNLEGGYGYLFEPGGPWAGFGRVRAGAALVRDPLWWTVGAIAETSRLAPGAFGVQGEVALFERGLWAQLGGVVDTHGFPGGHVALGFAAFGIEGQWRDAEAFSPHVALYGKLRVPVSVIVEWLTASPEPDR